MSVIFMTKEIEKERKSDTKDWGIEKETLSKLKASDFPSFRGSEIYFCDITGAWILKMIKVNFSMISVNLIFCLFLQNWVIKS